MTPTSDTPPLTPGEARYVQHLTRRILLAAAEHRHGDVLQHGDTIAVVYGLAGEWLLATTLATHACTTPLHQAVPPGDEEAPTLLHALARRHHATTPAGRARAIDDARKYAHRFTQAHTYGNSPRTAWNAVYRSTPPTLAALACTTLLILWAARSHKASPAPAFRLN